MIVKLKSKDKVNAGEVERLSSGKLIGFLPLICEDKKLSRSFSYDVSKLVTLKEFLSKPNTKESFINILQQIAQMMRACEEYSMSSEKLILDCDYVFVDYMTDQLLFIYYPVETYEPEGTVVDFIQQISSLVNGSKNVNNDFIIDFRKYSDSLKYFALVDFERKVESMSQGLSEKDNKKSHNSHHYSNNAAFNPFENELPVKDVDNNDYDTKKCICPKCNIEYVVGTKFCSECGENLTPLRGNTETADKKKPSPTEDDKKKKGKRRYWRSKKI